MASGASRSISARATRFCVPETGLRPITPETWELAETSPTYLKLVRMVEELKADERMDLLVLGWVGDGRSALARGLTTMDHLGSDDFGILTFSWGTW